MSKMTYEEHRELSRKNCRFIAVASLVLTLFFSLIGSVTVLASDINEPILWLTVMIASVIGSFCVVYTIAKL